MFARKTQKISRGGVAVARKAHNLFHAGSNPAHAKHLYLTVKIKNSKHIPVLYVILCMKHLRTTGKRGYDPHIQAFNIWNRGRRITPARIIGYFEALRAQKYSQSTLNVKRSALLSSIENRFVASRNFQSLGHYRYIFKRLRFRREKKPVEIVSREEMQRMIFASRRDPRKMVLLAAYWHSGGRLCEVLSIRLRDCRINHSEKIVTATVRGKGNKRIDLDFPLSVYQAAVRHFRGTNFLFENKKTGKNFSGRAVEDYVSRLGMRILNRRITPHTFRHSAATHLFKSGHSVKSISEFLHHSSAQLTLDIYIHDPAKAEVIQRELKMELQPQTEKRRTGNAKSVSNEHKRSGDSRHAI